MDDSEMDGPSYEKSKVCQETASQAKIEEEESYCFSHPRRGVAVIILYSQDFKGGERPGWKIDKENLQRTFSHLGFRVDIYQDLNKQDLMVHLQKVSREDHSDCDCFVLAVSSHGQECHVGGVREDTILTIDTSIKTREVVDMFTNKACPSLTGKPRLFFIQACRGQKLDHGHEILPEKSTSNDDTLDASPVDSDLTDVIPMGFIHHRYLHTMQQNTAVANLMSRLRHVTITKQGRQVLQEGALPKQVVSPAPCHEDFLVMYATPPGYFAFRRQNEGSWFVNSLTKVLYASDGTRNLTKELTRVIRLVAENFFSKNKDKDLHGKKQTPVLYSMLCKDIYMGPKKPLQDGR
ncbi:unnamed protein product [Candidula unifasciata]|uniref:Uncharacterized protein n=1 Tax=Candidula unifasciata TaxID=100452 RepID=A0A8S4A7T7_9EUPU|nr:unnamed protein product [Candidula unifasciata]